MYHKEILAFYAYGYFVTESLHLWILQFDFLMQYQLPSHSYYHETVRKQAARQRGNLFLVSFLFPSKALQKEAMATKNNFIETAGSVNSSVSIPSRTFFRHLSGFEFLGCRICHQRSAKGWRIFHCGNFTISIILITYDYIDYKVCNNTFMVLSHAFRPLNSLAFCF